ncbi:MAG: UDP-N-acetylmuramoyl-L-alanyl-D-glutamate--2,6-diaminopimelate ligase [Polaromonas sp.]|nr:UDP-N-acetylmuramoyl-L-alanyl-D-glutamate--2,6-diaminopimelate ligase [Polaromonas sp.]
MPLQCPEQAARWLHDHVSGTLRTDSRQVKTGDGFIAWPGAAHDGRHHVTAAVAAGARACLVDRDGVEGFGFGGHNVADYAGLKAAVGPIAAAYFDHPSRALQVVAVTGTNGKTTTAWWLAQALSRLGRRCGLVGTLGIGEPGAMVSNGLTTPDPVLLQQHLRLFVQSGYAACALEASSIGIEEHRLDSVAIDVAVFTNFTQDHLDYHADMNAYWAAKRALFDWPDLKSAVINLDDTKGVELFASVAHRSLDVWTFSCVTAARLQATAIHHGPTGVSFDVVESGQAQRIDTALVGHFNVSNLLGVLATLRTMGVSLDDAVQACTALLPVPGRMEVVTRAGEPLVIVDYAHTPDALDKVLAALKPIAQSRGGQLWCVFGCGGDRDAIKRPLMAKVVQQHADHIVVTSDNPRGEDPMVIIEQIRRGLRGSNGVRVEADRSQAIDYALRHANAQDVVLLAGKGHEPYQESQGIRLPYSDHLQVELALVARRTERTYTEPRT